ncbi:MAG: glycosyltransferase, partial [bacterium]
MIDTQHMEISVLMSVYIHTDPGELTECLESIQKQTLPASQIVIVLDGPVQTEVKKILYSFKEHHDHLVEMIEFTLNRGLGAALADGLNACHHELIARVDTDDRNLPSRFEVQHRYFTRSPEVSVVGGLLEEEDGNAKNRQSLIRFVPRESNKIIEYARYRNPMNHPTVMFKRSDVLSVGNYQTMLWFEDYHLWARMILGGFLLGNIDQVFVQTQADKNYFSRRGGLRYLKQELRLASEFRRIGFHNMFQSLYFVVSRFFI